MALTSFGVKILVRDQDGKTLLQMRDGVASISPLTWSLWGGAIDAQDRSPFECAARELGEELGIRAQPEDFALVDTHRSTLQSALLVAYVRPVQWGEFTVGEGAGAGFFWRDEIEKLALSATLRHYLNQYAELFCVRNYR